MPKKMDGWLNSTLHGVLALQGWIQSILVGPSQLLVLGRCDRAGRLLLLFYY